MVPISRALWLQQTRNLLDPAHPGAASSCGHMWTLLGRTTRGLWAAAAVVEGAVLVRGLLLFCGKTPCKLMLAAGAAALDFWMGKGLSSLYQSSFFSRRFQLIRTPKGMVFVSIMFNFLWPKHLIWAQCALLKFSVRCPTVLITYLYLKWCMGGIWWQVSRRWGERCDEEEQSSLPCTYPPTVLNFSF